MGKPESKKGGPKDTLENTDYTGQGVADFGNQQPTLQPSAQSPMNLDTPSGSVPSGGLRRSARLSARAALRNSTESRGEQTSARPARRRGASARASGRQEPTPTARDSQQDARQTTSSRRPGRNASSPHANPNPPLVRSDTSSSTGMGSYVLVTTPEQQHGYMENSTASTGSIIHVAPYVPPAAVNPSTSATSNPFLETARQLQRGIASSTHQGNTNIRQGPFDITQPPNMAANPFLNVPPPPHGGRISGRNQGGPGPSQNLTSVVSPYLRGPTPPRSPHMNVTGLAPNPFLSPYRQVVTDSDRFDSALSPAPSLGVGAEPITNPRVSSSGRSAFETFNATNTLSNPFQEGPATFAAGSSGRGPTPDQGSFGNSASNTAHTQRHNPPTAPPARGTLGRGNRGRSMRVARGRPASSGVHSVGSTMSSQQRRAVNDFFTQAEMRDAENEDDGDVDIIDFDPHSSPRGGPPFNNPFDPSGRSNPGAFSTAVAHLTASHAPPGALMIAPPRRSAPGPPPGQPPFGGQRPQTPIFGPRPSSSTGACRGNTPHIYPVRGLRGRGLRSSSRRDGSRSSDPVFGAPSSANPPAPRPGNVFTGPIAGNRAWATATGTRGRGGARRGTGRPFIELVGYEPQHGETGFRRSQTGYWFRERVVHPRDCGCGCLNNFSARAEEFMRDMMGDRTDRTGN